MDTIATVVDQHLGADVFVVGTGPSLRGFDFDRRLRDRVTIAINDAVFLFDPTFHLFNDGEIAGRYAESERTWRSVALWKNCARARPAWWQYYLDSYIVCRDRNLDGFVPLVPRMAGRILSYHQRGPDVDKGSDELWVGATTSCAAIQLAWKLGARRIYLLGVDACHVDGAKYSTDAPNSDGGPSGRVTLRLPDFDLDMLKLRDWFVASGAFDVANVVNLSPVSQVTAWRKSRWEEEFNGKDGA